MAQTILVVDDESKLRDLIRVYLEQEGYRVVEAGHGREALYVARVEKPDLVILDVMMPEMGGFEFMRAFGKEASTPVIMLTAKVDDSDKIVGLELGADDYVTKPFNVRELVKLAAELIATGDAESIEARLRSQKPFSLSTSVSKPGPALSDGKHRQLLELLQSHKGNVAAVARDMGCPRKNIYRWLEELNLDLAAFRE